MSVPRDLIYSMNVYLSPWMLVV